MFGAAVLLERRRMGGQGGRPKGDKEARTQLVRIDDDLAAMVSDLVKIGISKSSRELLAPMIRDKLTALHAKNKNRIDELKAAEEALQKTAEKIRAEVSEAPPDVTGETQPKKRKRPE